MNRSYQVLMLEAVETREVLLKHHLDPEKYRFTVTPAEAKDLLSRIRPPLPPNTLCGMPLFVEPCVCGECGQAIKE